MFVGLFVCFLFSCCIVCFCFEPVFGLLVQSRDPRLFQQPTQLFQPRRAVAARPSALEKDAIENRPRRQKRRRRRRRQQQRGRRQRREGRRWRERRSTRSVLAIWFSRVCFCRGVFHAGLFDRLFIVGSFFMKPTLFVSSLLYAQRTTHNAQMFSGGCVSSFVVYFRSLAYRVFCERPRTIA